MDRLNWRNWPLAVKLTLIMTTLVVATAASVTVLSIYREQQAFHVELERQAGLMLDTLSAAGADSLYYVDMDTLSTVATRLRETPTVVLTRFYDPEGRIIADAHDPALARRYEIDPFGRRLVDSEAIVFEWHSDRLVAGRGVTVGRQRLGAVSVGLSTAPLKAKVAAMRDQGFGVALAAVLAGTLLAWLVRRSITDPVREMVRATERIAGGDLTQRLAIHGGDELAVLASAFNNMTAQLQQTLTYLQESEERYALATRGANDGLWDWDLKANRVYFSPRWKSMLGHESDEVGNDLDEWLDRVHPDDREQVKVDLSAHVEGVSSHFENEHRTLHKDGTYRWMLSRGLAVRDADGKAYRMAGSQTDITDRKRAEEQLLHDAFHDALTGLPNRALFMDRLGQAVERAKRREDYLFAVLFLDLDRFKVVNDSLGHATGDELLVATARRLQVFLRAADTFARLGGDEFTILLEDINDVSDATRIAERIQEVLTVPFNLDGHEVFTTASIGIVPGAVGYDRPEDILRDADIAMYLAKAQGKARYELFDTSMRDRAAARLELETGLRRAVERGEFRLHYQPIVSLIAGRITGFEALLRWQHPVRGLISPGEFIPVAEETGLIISIGEWVLYEACRQLREWQMQFPTDPPLTVSVNLSAKQFTQPDLIKQIGRILQETSLDPGSLRLEITESAIMENAESASIMLSQLRGLGIQVQMDDFGTGYSSLSYLQRFPIDAIKIDRSFVSKMGVDGSRFEIIQTIVALAHDLSMDVVAEGVETEGQMVHLRALECEYGQGYHFSRPLDSEAARALIAAQPVLERTLISVGQDGYYEHAI